MDQELQLQSTDFVASLFSGHQIRNSSIIPERSQHGFVEAMQNRPDLSNGSECVAPNSSSMPLFTEFQGCPNGSEFNLPINLNNFQQSFVPENLWQMPTTPDWDWADIEGGQYSPHFLLNSNQCLYQIPQILFLHLYLHLDT
jgi:hypothetical protein